MRNKKTVCTKYILPTLSLFFITGCSSLWNDYEKAVTDEFKKQPSVKNEILAEKDIAHLPAPVKKYIAYTGSIGKSRLRNARFEFAAQMYVKNGEPPMESQSEQYNFFRSPARFFFIKSSRMLIPLRVLHSYTEEKTSFTVRAASLFNIVDMSGDELRKTETVTILNDICLFAPASLVDRRLSWKQLGPLSALVTFTNGKFIVSATLYFNNRGELVNFVSEDRSAAQNDGTLRRARWSTPVKDYIDFSGRKVPSYGEAVWNYPEGDFIYGKFTLKKIEYNIEGFRN